MQNKLSEDLNRLMIPVVTGLGYEYIGCEIQPRGRRVLIRVFIDSPPGATIDDCERVSRQLSAVFDVEDPIPGGYDLEVSSPGLDRPLFTLAHYQQFLGKKLKVKLHIPREGRRNFTGTLQRVEGQNLTVIGENGETWLFSFAEIEKGNLIAEY